MGFQAAIAIDESRANDVTVSDIVVGTHAHIVPSAAHTALGGLVGELGKDGVAFDDVAVAFGQVHAAADVRSVVEAVTRKEVPAFQAVVGREARAVHPRIAATDVDRAVEALPLVLFQDDINDARRAFSIITH